MKTFYLKSSNSTLLGNHLRWLLPNSDLQKMYSSMLFVAFIYGLQGSCTISRRWVLRVHIERSLHRPFSLASKWSFPVAKWSIGTFSHRRLSSLDTSARDTLGYPNQYSSLSPIDCFLVVSLPLFLSCRLHVRALLSRVKSDMKVRSHQYFLPDDKSSPLWFDYDKWRPAIQFIPFAIKASSTFHT